MGNLVPIEEVRMGSILDQDIFDANRQNIVYTRGICLTTEIINNILSLDYLEIDVIDGQSKNETQTINSIPKKTLKPGDYLFMQGEPAVSIFILQRGIVQIVVTKDTPPLDNPDKARRYVNEFGKVVAQVRNPKVKLGEMGALLGGKRTASIKCSTEVEVSEIAITEESFKQSIIQSPKLGLALAGTLAQRLLHSKTTAIRVKKIYDDFLNRTRLYQTAFEKIRSSLISKNESQQSLWMSKIINEFRNIPALSDNLKFKLPEINRENNVLELKEQILPIEMEIPVNINTYLAVSGRKQENIFILRKGKVIVPEDDGWTEIYSIPGQMLGHLEPLCKPFTLFKGIHQCDLKTISPVRLYKIPIKELETLCSQHPKLIIFICRYLSNELISEDQYIVSLLDILEKDIAILASGDTNFRRGYKKLNRVLEKFTKEPQLTEVELKLAQQMQEQVDKDYASFKDQITKLHFK